MFSKSYFFNKANPSKDVPFKDCPFCQKRYFLETDFLEKQYSAAYFFKRGTFIELQFFIN